MVGYVYILANRRQGTLYTGVTNDLSRRTGEPRLARPLVGHGRLDTRRVLMALPAGGVRV